MSWTDVGLVSCGVDKNTVCSSNMHSRIKAYASCSNCILTTATSVFAPCVATTATTTTTTATTSVLLLLLLLYLLPVLLLLPLRGWLRLLLLYCFSSYYSIFCSCFILATAAVTTTIGPFLGLPRFCFCHCHITLNMYASLELIQDLVLIVNLGYQLM
jgi:hypothetical protein